MTNSCDNRWTITGPKAELDRFLAEYITYDDGKPRLNLFDECMAMPGYWRKYDDCTKLDREGDAIKLEILTPNSQVPSVVLDVIAERFPSLMIEGDCCEFMMPFSCEFRLHGDNWDYKDTSAQLEAELDELFRKLDAEGR